MALDRDKTLQSAEKFAEKRKWDKAIQEYSKLVQDDPNDARILLKLGDAQVHIGAYPEAVATYDRAGRYYAMNPSSAGKAIAVFLQLRQIIQKHAPHLEEHYAHVPLRLADCYIARGLPSDALATLDELATRLLRAKREGQAIEVLRKMVSVDASNPLPHLKLGETLIRGGDADSGLAEFATAAAQLVRLGHRDYAIKVLERYLGLKTDAAQARIAAELYLERNAPGDGMQAITRLQICLQANPRDLDALALLARAFGAIGHHQKGIEVKKEMARIAKTDGRLPLFHQLLIELKRLAPYDDEVLALEEEPSEARVSLPPVRAASPVPPRAAARPEPQVYELPDEDDAIDATDDAEVLEDYVEELEEADLLDESVNSGPRHNTTEEHPAFDELDDPLAAGPTTMHEAYEDEARGMVLALERAEQLRGHGDPSGAAREIRKYLEIHPGVIDARLRLGELLIEANRTDEAVEELIEAASLQLEAMDADGAMASLETVLVFDPVNEHARAILGELQVRRSQEPPPVALAAYELEPELASEEPPMIGATEEISTARESDVDVRPEDPSLRTRVDRPAFDDDDFGIPAPFASEPEDQFEVSTKSTSLAELRESARPGSNLEEALDEAEFFASRGLVNDARTILREQLALHPNHPLIGERLEELDALESDGHQSSGTRSVPREDEEDHSFDIAASLDSLETLHEAAPPQQSMSATNQIDADEVFRQFKEGISKQISVDDAQTRYDLGLTYKEMGLFDDAIREFGYASRDASRAANCEWLIGTIHMLQGNLVAATEAFQRGLASEERRSDDEIVLNYDLGLAFVARKMAREALRCFQVVASREPDYRDVAEHIRRLTRIDSMRPSAKSSQASADEEFDRAFEDLLGEKKSGSRR